MDIKSYAVNNDGIKLLHEAINIFADGEKFHDSMSRKFHMCGLQGMKRWHRVQSKDDRCHSIDLQHYVIDQYSENLEVTSDYMPPTPVDLESGLKAYLDWELSVYKRLAKISNDLIILEYPHESYLVKKDIDGVIKEIEKIRRWLQDFEKSNWNWAYIRIVDNRLHDKMKEIEGA